MTYPLTAVPRKAAIIRMAIQTGFDAYCDGLMRRSTAIAGWLSRNAGAICLAWFSLFSFAAAIRLLFPATPVHGWGDALEMALPYGLIALSPVIGFKLASACFPPGTLCQQPEFRLALYGRWRRLNVLEARSNPLFGPAGFMASLLVGLMLNVVFRSFEFLLSMPPVNHHGPEWAQRMFMIMAADVVVMSFFYMVCFVMALRTIPLFPRMLLFVWALDIVMQLIIAREIGTMPGLPVEVAAPLKGLLEGNIKKVLISAFVWIPYLMLSERVNITYRQRRRVS